MLKYLHLLFIYFYSKQKNCWKKEPNHLITGLRLKDWEVFKGEWNEALLLKPNLLSVLPLDAPWAQLEMHSCCCRHDDEIMSSSFRGYDSNLTVCLLYGTRKIRLLSSFASPSCRPQDTPDCSSSSLKRNLQSATLFFFNHTHVPLMLPPKCPLNSLSSRRQESVFLIL